MTSPEEYGLLRSALSPLLTDYETAAGNPDFSNIRVADKNLFEEKHRAAWDKSTEARCNFEFKPRSTKRGGVRFFSLWQKSIMGRTLTDIKSDEAEILHFAKATSDFLVDTLGPNLNLGHWALCTTPKRRHKERNFATLICIEIHKLLNIPFYEDVAICRSRQRINAVFELNCLPKEPNIIVFDDFVTTGSTLKSMHELLMKHNKTLLFMTGINNAL